MRLEVHEFESVCGYFWTAHCIWHIEQQMMGLEMGSRHTGPCRSGLGRHVFPECDKVRFATGKDLLNY